MDTLKSNSEITQVLTKDDLVNQLRHIGINESMILEVHSSFNSLGYVVGGAKSLLDALFEVLGTKGTLVMSCQNSENSEPLFWCNPPISINLTDKLRNSTTGFDPKSANISHMGVMAELLRGDPDTKFSSHPNCAFMAKGRLAEQLTENQPLDFPLYKNSPIEKMYNEQGYVLLIGVGYDKCTSMHYSEYLSQCRSIVLNGGAIKEDGKDVWKKYLDIQLDSDEFEEIGKAMERAKIVKTGKLGNATCKFFSIKKAIDYSSKYLKEKYK